MKKLIAVFLTVSMLILICGCQGNDTVSSDNPSSSQNEASSEADTSSPSSEPSSTPVSTEEQAPDYTLLSCRQVKDSEWVTVRLNNTLSDITMQLDLPSDWSLSAQTDELYEIYRSNKKIGEISTYPQPAAQETIESVNSHSEEKQLSCTRNFGLYKENGKDIFYRNFQFVCYKSTKECALNIRVDYTELDNASARALSEKAFTVYKPRNYTPVKSTNGSKKILILGNSFISSSTIGNILTDMLTQAGSDYTAIARSVGYANIATFANDEYLLNCIKNGDYAYVFQCGFYSHKDVSQLTYIKEACDASNTHLVIFPAHNEDPGSVISATRNFPDLLYLDWQAEINALIDQGHETGLFCKNDYHKHSTPLAGYVGAKMIYRALFGKNPPDITPTLKLNMDHVRTALGEYADSESFLTTFMGKVYNIR